MKNTRKDQIEAFTGHHLICRNGTSPSPPQACGGEGWGEEAFSRTPLPGPLPAARGEGTHSLPSCQEPRCAQAFTLVELLVVIATIVLLVSIALPALAKAGQNEQRLSCVNNLKQVGAAYRLWAGDHGGKVPAQQTVGNGGYLDAVFGPAVTSQMTMASISTNYNLLAGALGNSTKLLVCPADDRSAAFIFPILNTACSYFVGVGANDNYPQSIEGGDRNMGIVGDPSYGFSGTPSYMGAGDMVLNLGTNGGSASVNSGKPAMITTSTTGAIGWSLKLHSASSATGAGNLLLGDGSVQQASTSALNIYLNSASDSGNFYSASALSTSQYARYLFP